jgi:hypothetical protein
MLKKARQRKRRDIAERQFQRQEEKFEDKFFAASLKRDMKKGTNSSLLPPHCEWNGTDFVPTQPKPSPKLDVNVSVMHVAHEKFGIH